MDPPVFFGSALLVIVLTSFGGGWSETAERIFGALQSFIATRLGWLYVLIVTALLVFVIVLACSRFGRVRLGPDDAQPEFGRLSWIAMLFAAGMGVGLVFFGVAEPLTHWDRPPTGGEPRTDAAVVESLRFSFFHWGLHPWAIYATLAVALALMHFRYGLPLAPRSLLHPLLGERIHGPIGKGVDIICTVGTLIGVAASLGLGALQINAGIERIGWGAYDRAVQLTIIGVITFTATISVVSGIQYGIRRLSQLNLGLCSLLCLWVFIAGPTFFVLDLFVTGLGRYFQELVRTSLWIAPIRPESEAWQRDWTLSYWGWWLAWSPFVGVFLARISKGRTVRELVLTALTVPTVGSFFWMSVFGGTGLAIARESFGSADGDAFTTSILERPAIALHALLEQLPFGAVTGVLATLLTVVFFVTSSDSGSLVDDMVTSGGDPNPPRAQRVFWAVSEGAMAAGLLVTDGIDALRAAAVTVGLPMALLLLVTAWAMWRGLGRREGRAPDAGGG